MKKTLKRLTKDLDEANSILREIVVMQKQNYGNGTNTHLALIDLSKKADKYLQSQSLQSKEQKTKGSEGEKIDITKQVYGPASSKNYFGDERDGNLTN